MNRSDYHHVIGYQSSFLEFLINSVSTQKLGGKYISAVVVCTHHAKFHFSHPTVSLRSRHEHRLIKIEARAGKLRDSDELASRRNKPS